MQRCDDDATTMPRGPDYIFVTRDETRASRTLIDRFPINVSGGYKCHEIVHGSLLYHRLFDAPFSPCRVPRDFRVTHESQGVEGPRFLSPRFVDWFSILNIARRISVLRNFYRRNIILMQKSEYFVLETKKRKIWNKIWNKGRKINELLGGKFVLVEVIKI